MTKRMVRVTAPGLPPLPRLYFDPQQRRAIVAARHPTWQSHQHAIRATELTSWAVTILVAFLLWPAIGTDDMVFRVSVFVFAVALVYEIVNYLLHRTWRYFLARQMFATRTVLWFTPEAIAFRSRLYAKPVVIWRKWKSLPVRVKFILQRDLDIPSPNPRARHTKNIPTEHLQEAMVLELVLTAHDRRRDVNTGGQDAVLRAIPITEISSRWATRFTMVYSAAAMLTSPVQRPMEEGIRGADIDAI